MQTKIEGVTMHLAILVTNTDLSDFAHQHPFDGEKFEKMINSVRPDWRCSVFLCHQNEFPKEWDKFDGLIITGSPASVHDDDPWVARLMTLVRQIVDRNKPLYGACYGHQAIALALGGAVGPNPQGWVFGLVNSSVVNAQPWMSSIGANHRQFAAHKEQVRVLPEAAKVVTSAPQVPYAGFAIGNTVYTSQNHPEMLRQFFTALLKEYSKGLGPDVTRSAYQTLEKSDDNLAYAETIAAFFEQAINQPSPANP